MAVRLFSPKFLLVLLFTAALSACSGGGSEDENPGADGPKRETSSDEWGTMKWNEGTWG